MKLDYKIASLYLKYREKLESHNFISTSVNSPDCKLGGARQVGEVWKLHIVYVI